MAELDAAESKKPKTEHGKMAEEACLCLVTERELYAIKLRNLKKQEDDVLKDSTCLPSPDFEFVLPLPERYLCPFEFDSKIFMASTGRMDFGFSSKSHHMKDLFPFPIYEIKFEEKHILVAESLDPAPLPLHSSFIANTPGSGDVFFHIDQRNPGVNVVAILVNHHNGRIAFYQRLYMCFEGIQPVMYGGSRFNVVDLGNGKLCATLCGQQLDSTSTLCGQQLDSTSSALCVSIFTLSVAKDFADFAELDSGAPPMERDFLQVDVHTKNIYNIKGWNACNSVRHTFVWPPTKGGTFQHRTLIA
ncbi:hypothetical protein PIB30_085241 [Stylosanthes scabra]|uniref:Uncharacterized protein n=1 Tax=Stylosanthes scabra TaxID=79078 RepID=A0ABU6XTW4_9FABA|nr:hypothetical protein [Stylosanthes scabra]